MSWTGKCPECGTAALTANIVGMTTRSGPAWRRWRRAMAASVGARLPDDDAA